MMEFDLKDETEILQEKLAHFAKEMRKEAEMPKYAHKREELLECAEMIEKKLGFLG